MILRPASGEVHRPGEKPARTSKRGPKGHVTQGPIWLWLTGGFDRADIRSLLEYVKGFKRPYAQGSKTACSGSLGCLLVGC